MNGINPKKDTDSKKVSGDGKRFLDLFLESIGQSAPQFGEVRLVFHQGDIVNLSREEKTVFLR
jgi:hypothetical protein